MKMLSLILVATISSPAWSQKFQAALEESQNKLQEQGSTTVSESTVMTPTVKVEKKESGICENENQNSIPLKYLTSLIRQKDGNLKISHDPRSGKVKVSTGPFILEIVHR